MIDAAQLGERLRRARERRGLSQQAVAEALGLPRTAVTNIETGNRTVATLELARLADLYGASPAGFFAADAAPAEEDAAVVLPRVLASLDGAPEFHAAVQRVWSLCREGATLRKLLGRAPEPVIPSYAGPLGTAGDAVRQGEAIAREERRRLGLGNAPVGPIADLIGSQGIWVAACPLPADMSGLFLSHPSIGPTIVVNNNGHAPVRRRFSYAHEYGHALCDRDTAWRATRHGNAHELGETRANAFAAAFLLPAEGVADQLRQLDKGRPSRQLQIVYDNTGEAAAESEVEIRPRAGSQTITWQDVRQLARHFGVSYESAIWRLKNLGHITQPEVTALLAQKGKNLGLDEILHLRLDEVLPPPDDAEQTLDGQLVRLAIEAFRREEISLGRLRELAGKLGVPPEALAELAATTDGG